MCFIGAEEGGDAAAQECLTTITNILEELRELKIPVSPSELMLSGDDDLVQAHFNRQATRLLLLLLLLQGLFRRAHLTTQNSPQKPFLWLMFFVGGPCQGKQNKSLTTRLLSYLVDSTD